MSSLLSLSLKLHLELSSFLQLVYPFTLLSFKNYHVSLANCNKALLHLDLASLFVKNLVNIRLYYASGTYRTASRARTVSSLFAILTVPLPKPRKSCHPPSWQSLPPLQLKSYWTGLSEKIHKPYYLNQISSLYLEKCYHRKKPLIFWCPLHRLLRLPPQLVPSSSVTIVDTCSHFPMTFSVIKVTRLWWARTFSSFSSSFPSCDHQNPIMSTPIDLTFF